MPRAVLPLLLVALAAGSAWLAWLRPAEQQPPPGRDGTPRADYFLKQLALKHYGADGQLQRTLKAERAEHQPQGGTRLTAPRITLESQPGSPWQIDAEQGLLSQDGETLTLPGRVVISRLATPYNRAMELRTRDLHYRQTAGYAETDQAVTVKSNGSRIEAVGLKAWLASPGRIQFLSQVRAHYEP